MGNVVSSVLMYALQVAWFCQRLIDQDYRQNHGSRMKPIMGTEETDLDVFLSKCKSYYYLADGPNRHRRRFGRNERHRRAEHVKRKRNHHRNGSQTAISTEHPQRRSEAADWRLPECDGNASLPRGLDRKCASRTPPASPLANNSETDADTFRSRRRLLYEFSKSSDSNDLEQERHDLDLSEVGKRKRKGFFLGKSLRESVDTTESECEAFTVANCRSLPFDGGELFDRSPVPGEDFAGVEPSGERDPSQTDGREAASTAGVDGAPDLSSRTDYVESCRKRQELAANHRDGYREKLSEKFPTGIMSCYSVLVN